MANTSNRALYRASRSLSPVIACRAPQCVARCNSSSRKAAFFGAAVAARMRREVAYTLTRIRCGVALRRREHRREGKHGNRAERCRPKCPRHCRRRIPNWEISRSPFSAPARSMVNRSSSASLICRRRLRSATAFVAAARRRQRLEKLAKDVRGVQQVTTAVAADAIASKQLKVAIGAPLLARTCSVFGRRRRAARSGRNAVAAGPGSSPGHAVARRQVASALAAQVRLIGPGSA